MRPGGHSRNMRGLEPADRRATGIPELFLHRPTPAFCAGHPPRNPYQGQRCSWPTSRRVRTTKIVAAGLEPGPDMLLHGQSPLPLLCPAACPPLHPQGPEPLCQVNGGRKPLQGTRQSPGCSSAAMTRGSRTLVLSQTSSSLWPQHPSWHCQHPWPRLRLTLVELPLQTLHLRLVPADPVDPLRAQPCRRQHRYQALGCRLLLGALRVLWLTQGLNPSPADLTSHFKSTCSMVKMRIAQIHRS